MVIKGNKNQTRRLGVIVIDENGDRTALLKGNDDMPINPEKIEVDPNTGLTTIY